MCLWLKKLTLNSQPETLKPLDREPLNPVLPLGFRKVKADIPKSAHSPNMQGLVKTAVVLVRGSFTKFLV